MATSNSVDSTSKMLIGGIVASAKSKLTSVPQTQYKTYTIALFARTKF